jgi:glycosyltransferase involved in cell wall biosynthesis
VVQTDNKLRRQIITILIKSKIIFVLATEFKNKLVEWGIPENKIHVENTMIDDDLLRNFSIHNINKRADNKNVNLLFLSRIVREKGIYEILETYKILKSRFKNLILNIAGTGPELSAIRRKAKNEKLDVNFLGYVSGDNKIKLYEESDIYLLPSQSEGCPISLLEAFAFGLPAIVTPVGGIPDFFKDQKMGYMTKNITPDNLVTLLEFLIKDERSRHSISVYNYEYSQEHFLASKVIKRIESKINDAL